MKEYKDIAREIDIKSNRLVYEAFRAGAEYAFDICGRGQEGRGGSGFLFDAARELSETIREAYKEGFNSGYEVAREICEQ